MLESDLQPLNAVASLWWNAYQRCAKCYSWVSINVNYDKLMFNDDGDSNGYGRNDGDHAMMIMIMS